MHGNIKELIKPRKNYFDSDLTEAGPPALLTDKGILVMYNGKNATGDNGDKRYTANTYAAGQVLFDAKNPEKVIGRLDKPFFVPTEPFEKSGQYPAGTVFTEGLIYHQQKWFLYYGCADSRVAVAIFDPATLQQSSARQALKFANALQSNMVVQQNKPFKIWGKAKSGSEVNIKADWLSNEVRVTADQDGHFMGIISVPEIAKGDFTSHEVSISSAGETKTLTNVLIGDVWFCSGQSNMQFALKEDLHAKEELVKASFPNVRLFNTGLNFSNTPIDTLSGHWVVCSNQTAANFSAVAYYFGKELYKDLQIPIGLIFSGIGASSAQAYVPREYLEKDTLLDSVYLEPYLKSPKSKEVINSGFSFEKVVRPYLLYNAMINPFINLSIKGICWYQGEANHMERESYTRLTQTLITAWRNKFGQGSLPFYYVQIAPFFHDKENPDLNFDAYFREAQEKISVLNNTAMVQTIDVGEAKDLHPKNKQPVGARLAYTALNRTYGKLDVTYQGPEMDEVIFKKNTAIVSFIPASIKNGLRTNDGNPPQFFYIAGADQIFHKAAAKIEGNTVIVTSKEVKKPAALRYAFFNYPVTNLENNDGLPALPFRTDHWPEKL